MRYLDDVTGLSTDVGGTAGGISVKGPLTDAQLRAAAVPVSGPVSVSNFPAGFLSAQSGGWTVGVSGTVPVSGAFFQATQPVSGPLTDTQLRAAVVPVSLSSTTITGSVAVTGAFFQATQPVSGAFFQTTQPVSVATLPLPAGASTEATLALIKAKTDNLDVLLSTRTKPADAQLQQPASLGGTATGAAGAAVTLTIPAGGVGLTHHIAYIEITAYSTAARTGGATPVLVTTTNLPGTPAFTFASAGAVGTTDRYMPPFASPRRATAANTATAIVCPATPNVIWRVNANWYNAA